MLLREAAQVCLTRQGDAPCGKPERSGEEERRRAASHMLGCHTGAQTFATRNQDRDREDQAAAGRLTESSRLDTAYSRRQLAMSIDLVSLVFQLPDHADARCISDWLIEIHYIYIYKTIVELNIMLCN